MADDDRPPIPPTRTTSLSLPPLPPSPTELPRGSAPRIVDNVFTFELNNDLDHLNLFNSNRYFEFRQWPRHLNIPLMLPEEEAYKPRFARCGTPRPRTCSQNEGENDEDSDSGSGSDSDVEVPNKVDTSSSSSDDEDGGGEARFNSTGGVPEGFCWVHISIV